MFVLKARHLMAAGLVSLAAWSAGATAGAVEQLNAFVSNVTTARGEESRLGHGVQGQGECHPHQHWMHPPAASAQQRRGQRAQGALPITAGPPGVRGIGDRRLRQPRAGQGRFRA